MPRSLDARLNGNGDDFLEDIKLYNRWGALAKWKDRLGGYHDYLGLCKWIKDKTGNPNFGLTGTLGGAGANITPKSIWMEVETRIYELRAENAHLREECKKKDAIIKSLEDEDAREFEPTWRSIMAVCRG